jgi:5-formyltetrahydrofolate cyclo-ligase
MKDEIRQKLLYKRVQQSPDDKEPKDQKIVHEIEQTSAFQNANYILMYISIHGEVDLAKLFEKHRVNKKFVLPRIQKEEKSLTLYQINSLEDLTKGAYSIPEPKEHLEKIPLEKIDLVIVPGIAYATDGHRIGYGGGFYDKLLKKMDCPKIGVAYEFQIVENTGEEDHDEKVDIIITEKQIINIP